MWSLVNGDELQFISFTFYLALLQALLRILVCIPCVLHMFLEFVYFALIIYPNKTLFVQYFMFFFVFFPLTL